MRRSQSTEQLAFDHEIEMTFQMQFHERAHAREDNVEDNLIPVQWNNDDLDIDNMPMAEFTSAKPHINISCFIMPIIQARDYDIKTFVMQTIQNSIMFRGS